MNSIRGGSATTKMTVRTHTPVVTNMSIPADEARIAIIANSHNITSNDIFYIGTTTSNRDAYIAIDDNTDIKNVAVFKENDIVFYADTVISGSVSPHAARSITGWRNMYVGSNLYLGDNAAICSDYSSNSSISFINRSDNASNTYITLKSKNISFHHTQYKSILSVSSANGTLLEMYDSEDVLLKTINLSAFSTADVAEGTSNLYYTDERVSNLIENINMQSSSVAANMLGNFIDIVGNSSNAFIDDVRHIDSNIISYVQYNYNILGCNLQRDQSHHIDYISRTCNQLQNTINNTLKIFVPQLISIDGNNSNYLRRTSNNILRILANSSNSNFKELNSKDKSSSNYISRSSNDIARHLIEAVASNNITINEVFNNISNEIITTSNELYKIMVANSNTLFQLTASCNVNTSQLIVDMSNVLFMNIADSSNIISLDITSNYSKIAEYLTQSVSNIESTLSREYTAISNRISSLSLDNISDADQAVKFIVNNIYDNDLTVNNLTVRGNIIPSEDGIYHLGTSHNRWKDLYVSGNTIHIGEAKISLSPTGGIEIKNNLDEYYDIVVSRLVVQDTDTGTLTVLQSTSNEINLATTVSGGSDTGDSSTTNSLEKTLFTNDIVETSNLYYTDERAAKIIAASNIEVIRYIEQTSNSLIQKITNLNTDQIANGTSNQYIVNGIYPKDLVVAATLTASNLDIKGDFTYIYTNSNQTEILKIDTSSSDGPALKIEQYNTFSNMIEFYNEVDVKPVVVITENGDIGIGQTIPVAKIDVNGNIKASGNINDIGADEIGYLSGIRANVQLQINTIVKDTSNHTSNVYIVTMKQQRDSSNLTSAAISRLNSNMIVYFDKSSNAFASNIATTSNNLARYDVMINSNVLRYLSTNVSNVFNINIPDVSDKIGNRIDVINGNLNSYTSNTSNRMEDSIRSTLNPITQRINTITSTEWVSISGANGSNTYYMNNVGIGGLPSGLSTEKLTVYGNIKFRDNVNYTSSNELNFLSTTSSNIQAQINIVASNLLNYTSNTSNAYIAAIQTTSNNIMATTTSLNSNFISYIRNTSNFMDVAIRNTSNSLNSQYNRFISQGYTPGQWSNASDNSNIYYLRGNIAIGTSNIGTSNELEISAGDMMITGGDMKKLSTYTSSYALNPVIWYQFNDDVLNSNILYDSNIFSTSSVKYNMNISNMFLGNNIYSVASSNSLVTSNYCYNTSNDLVAWYRFDNNNMIKDSSGNNSNLQYVYHTFSGNHFFTDYISDYPINPPYLNISNFVKGTSSIHFINRGSSINYGNYGLCRTHHGDQFIRPLEFTIVFWIYMPDSSTSISYIVSATTVAGSLNWRYGWFIYKSNSTLKFSCYSGDSNSHSEYNIDVLYTKSWKHYAIVLKRPNNNYNTKATVDIYIDGKHNKIINDVNYFNTGSSGFYGNYSSAWTNPRFYIGGITGNSDFLGENIQLDDIRFYKKTLSANEISAIYNGYSIENISNNTLVNYLWKNAFSWNLGDLSIVDNGFLYYTNSENLRLLLNSFHHAQTFSIHFVFQTTNTSITSEILYIGNNTNDFIRVYISNNTFNFQVGTANATYNITANLFYIIDLIFTVVSGNIVLNIYSNGLNVQTLNSSISYSSLLLNTDLDGLVYYIGKYKNTNADASPVTLQDFRIFSYTLSSGDIQALQRGSTFYMISNNVNEKYSLERWQSSSTYYDFGGNKFITYNEGNVGIGTSNPQTKLHVGAGGISSNLLVGYFNSNTALTSATTTINNICSVFDSSIWCKSTIAAASDSRIKKNIVDIDDNTALDKIMAIEPKTYEYIDHLKGTDKVYGFLAQQIGEVIPEAVSLRKEVIPDVFCIAECINGNTIILSSNVDIHWMQNKSVSIIDMSGYCELYRVIGVDNDTRSFVIDREIANSPKVFVYGSEVDDFHTLDKQYIYTLNVCATQILSRELDQLENRVKELEKQYNVSNTDYLLWQQQRRS